MEGVVPGAVERERRADRAPRSGRSGSARTRRRRSRAAAPARAPAPSACAQRSGSVSGGGSATTMRPAASSAATSRPAAVSAARSASALPGQRAVEQPAVAARAEAVERGERGDHLARIRDEDRQMRAPARAHVAVERRADVHHATGIRRATRVPPPGRGPTSHVAAARAGALAHDRAGRSARRRVPRDRRRRIPARRRRPRSSSRSPSTRRTTVAVCACECWTTLASDSASTRETTTTASGRTSAAEPRTVSCTGRPPRSNRSTVVSTAVRSPPSGTGTRRSSSRERTIRCAAGDRVAQARAARARLGVGRRPARPAARARGARPRGPARARRARRRRGSGARAPSPRAARAGAAAPS